MKKRLDIVDIKAAVKSGQLSAYVDAEGNIILHDNQTGEGVSLGKAGTKREKGAR